MFICACDFFCLPPESPLPLPSTPGLNSKQTLGISEQPHHHIGAELDSVVQAFQRTGAAGS